MNKSRADSVAEQNVSQTPSQAFTMVGFPNETLDKSGKRVTAAVNRQTVAAQSNKGGSESPTKKGTKPED